MTRDLYDELGVEKSADNATIKRAYRKRAMETHPDRGGDEEEFKRVNFAMEVLADPERRAHYDSTGQDNVGRSAEDEAAQLLREILSAALNAPKGKYLALARGRLLKMQVEIDSQLPAIKALKKQLEDRRGRTKHKGDGPNLAHAVIDAAIARADNQLGMAAHKQQVLKDALAMLDAYTNDEEADPEQSPFMGTIFTTVRR